MPADAVTEEAFAALAEGLHALGMAEETDADTAFTERLAWFDLPADENTGEQTGEQAMRGRITAAATAQGLDAAQLSLNLLEQQNWETAWQKDWQAVALGKNLWVRPSFCDAPRDGRTDIVLDPGMAFGTGTHPTTQLCLQAVERVCESNPPATLLDMGAGSGILAIAAMKLGCGTALCIDMEEESVEACHTNAAINGVQLDAQLDDTPPARQFDLVVANILAAPLVWMAAELAPCVGERLVLSGLLVTQVDDVAAAYLAEGLCELRRDALGEWASVEFGR